MIFMISNASIISRENDIVLAGKDASRHCSPRSLTVSLKIFLATEDAERGLHRRSASLNIYIGMI